MCINFLFFHNILEPQETKKIEEYVPPMKNSLTISKVCDDLFKKWGGIDLIAAYEWNKHIKVYVNQITEEINLDSLRLFCLKNIGPATEDDPRFNESIVVDYGEHGFLLFSQFSKGSWMIVCCSKRLYPLVNLELRKIDKPSVVFDLEEIKAEEIVEVTSAVDESAHLELENVDPRLLAAKRLQLSILPNLNTIKNYFNTFFSFYSPEDILSGDFYWTREVGDELYLIVADCTGHSVEGALATMTINSLFNHKFDNDLDKFIRTVYAELVKSEDSEVLGYSVGVEFAVMKLNKASHQLEIASSGLPALYLSDQETTIIKPRGIRDPYSPDVTIEIKKMKAKKGDRVVLYSDGLADQFDKENKKKLGNSGVKKLFASMNGSFSEKEFKNKFLEWKGSTAQLDDVTVMALEI